MSKKSGLSLDAFRVVYEPFDNSFNITTVSGEIHTKKNDISSNITEYKTAYDEIGTNYNYGLSAEISLFPKKDRIDVTQQDLEYMIGHQEQTYFVAIITIATLLVSTFYIIAKR